MTSRGISGQVTSNVEWYYLNEEGNIMLCIILLMMFVYPKLQTCYSMREATKIRNWGTLGGK